MSEDIDSFIKHQKAKLAAERDTLDNATSPRENVSLQLCVDLSALGFICTSNFTRVFIKDVTYNIYFDYFDGISVVLGKGGKALCCKIICKKVFPSNANRPLADCLGYIVNKFEHLGQGWGSMYCEDGAGAKVEARGPRHDLIIFQR